MGFLHLVPLILGDRQAGARSGIHRRRTSRGLADQLDPHRHHLFKLRKYWPLGGAAVIGTVFSGILLGALFGMPQIAK